MSYTIKTTRSMRDKSQCSGHVMKAHRKVAGKVRSKCTKCDYTEDAPISGPTLRKVMAREVADA